MSNKTSSIPKIIHQIWLGDDIPLLQTLYMSKWKTMRGWKYKLWNNEDITKKNFPKTWNYIKKALDISTETGKNKFAQIADLMRLEVLYKYGGLYADATLEPLKNFKGLIKPEDEFVISNEDPCGLDCYNEDVDMYYISNSFIASVPKHVILKRALRKTTLDKINFLSNKVNIETGPFFLRKNIKYTDNIKILPTDIIYPFGYDTVYKKGNDDMCFFYKKNEKSNITIRTSDNNKIYIQYPCMSYPNSYAIKHWDVGGSWIIK